MEHTESKTRTLREAKRREEELTKAKNQLETELAIAISREQARAKHEETKILKKPWRTFERGGDWNNQYRNKLVEDIKSYTYFGDLDSKVVLLGPINAGKSSFISSIASIDKGRISQAALVGSGPGDSFTKAHYKHIPKGYLSGKYQLMYAMGIEETTGNGFCIQDIIYLMQGNIPANYKFKPDRPINPQDEGFVAEPTLKDKPQCVVLVVDSNLLDLEAFSDDIKRKLRELQCFIMTHVVPIVLVLTKVDDLCTEDGIEITDIYKSRRIETVVDRARELFGVPAMNIFPVQNYSKEIHLDDNIDILLLLAFKGILNMAYDHLEHLEDQQH